MNIAHTAVSRTMSSKHSVIFWYNHVLSAVVSIANAEVRGKDGTRSRSAFFSVLTFWPCLGWHCWSTNDSAARFTDVRPLYFAPIHPVLLASSCSCCPFWHVRHLRETARYLPTVDIRFRHIVCSTIIPTIALVDSTSYGYCVLRV